MQYIPATQLIDNYLIIVIAWSTFVQKKWTGVLPLYIMQQKMRRETIRLLVYSMYNGKDCMFLECYQKIIIQFSIQYKVFVGNRDGSHSINLVVSCTLQTTRIPPFEIPNTRSASHFQKGLNVIRLSSRRIVHVFSNQFCDTFSLLVFSKSFVS